MKINSSHFFLWPDLGHLCFCWPAGCQGQPCFALLLKEQTQTDFAEVMAFVPVPVPRDQTLTKPEARAYECSLQQNFQHSKRSCHPLLPASLGTKANFHFNCASVHCLWAQKYIIHIIPKETQLMQQSKYSKATTGNQH